MIKVSLLFILLTSNLSYAGQNQMNLIVENCKSCHNLNINVTDKIPSLNSLKKEEFIKLMTIYKNDKDNSVMNRISKVLSNQDIKLIADIIYDKE